MRASSPVFSICFGFFFENLVVSECTNVRAVLVFGGVIAEVKDVDKPSIRACGYSVESTHFAQAFISCHGVNFAPNC